jgi:transcription elongation factor Elf1
MIVKEIDAPTSKDRFSQAGFKAEQKMAHYLSRAFKDAEDILVLNGIRLKSDDDSAQIDHLIIHRYGMVIIESKSAVGTIKIHDHGEWSRAGYDKGMASPVEQAQRQAVFLRSYLNRSGLKPPHDVWKSLIREITYDHVPVDVLVAISDTGIIDRPHDLKIKEVHKADMIPATVREIIAHYKKLDNPFSLTLTATPLKISPELMMDIARFLRRSHVPRGQVGRSQTGQEKVTSRRPTRVRTEFTCRECGSVNLSIQYAKFGYYFRCGKCSKTMSIREYCPTCGQQSRLRKAGNQFYIECRQCNTSGAFFKNPS